MRDAFISELTALAREDSSVFLVVGDLGFSVIEEFANEFPDRFLNAGVAEQTMIGVASGLASVGFSVFVYSIGNFPTMRCIEQIRNDVCYHKRSVTVVSVGAGFSYGYLGYTHHAIEDIAVMRALPNMTVYSPSDPVEVRAATRLAVEAKAPSYLRLAKNGEPTLHPDGEIPDVTKHQLLAPGTDLAILSTGSITSVALEARDRLAGEGISAAVISVPRIKPLDPSVFEAVAGAKAILTLEEHSIVGGFGSAVLEAASRSYVRTPIYTLGALESEVGKHIGSQAYIRTKNQIDVDAVCRTAHEFLATL